MEAVDPKYKTLWPRFWAYMIDIVIIVVPITIIHKLIFTNPHSYIAVIIFYSVSFATWFCYRIFSHSTVGQTMGKKATNIILLENDEVQKLTLYQSFKRELIPMGINLIPLLYLIITFYSEDKMMLQVADMTTWIFGKSQAEKTADILSISGTCLWLIILIITTQSDNKGKGPHDNLSGSVVIFKKVQGNNNMNAIHEKYKTFWRRFWASIIDSIIISIPIFALDYLFLYEHVGIGEKSLSAYLQSYNKGLLSSTLILSTISPLIYIVYSVYLTGIHGGTLGKKAMGITVLDGDDEQNFIGIKRAVIRDLPYIIAECIGIAYMIVIFGSGDELIVHEDSVLRIIDNLVGIWALAELITMLGNERRRAIHDILANSVVVKKVQEEAIPQ